MCLYTCLVDMCVYIHIVYIYIYRYVNTIYKHMWCMHIHTYTYLCSYVYVCVYIYMLYVDRALYTYLHPYFQPRSLGPSSSFSMAPRCSGFGFMAGDPKELQVGVPSFGLKALDLGSWFLMCLLG